MISRPDLDHARRAVRRYHAGAGRRDVRAVPQDEGRGNDNSSGRAERRIGARHRRSCLCAGSGRGGVSRRRGQLAGR